MKPCSFFLIGLMLLLSARGQLCQGSLGDPIVNITFGSGPNPGPPLQVATTNYKFRAGDCPDDGYYTIVNSTHSCFDNTWHTVITDHTANPSGYFMLVNASFQPSAFYIDTVSALCNNTTYEFAAWVMNVLGVTKCSDNPIEPNLTFNIEKTDGTILQSYNTGPLAALPGPEWKQYGFFFSTPANENRVVVRIINNAAGGCGNDLALDDITFRPCGPILTASIKGDGVTKEFCEGDTGQQIFTCQVSPEYTNPIFQWQESRDSGRTWLDIFGANTTTLTRYFSAMPAGEYRYRMRTSKIENAMAPECSISSNSIIIRIAARPVPSIISNMPFCEGRPIILSASDGIQYVWSGPNAFVAQGETIHIENAQFSHSGTYYILVTNSAGCTSKDSIILTVRPTPQATVQPESVSICEGTTTTLTASGGDTYTWLPPVHLSSTSGAQITAQPTDSTRYTVIVSNAFLCADTAYVTINVSKKPVANAGPDRVALSGHGTQLLGSIAGTNISYHWSPALFIEDIGLIQPRVHPDTNIVYTLQVESNDGCGFSSDDVTVRVYKAIYVPNAFTPNNDGLNDVWNIPALHAFTNYEVTIFNRYGQIIYHSKSMDNPWDGRYKGKSQPAGLYPYVIDIKELSQKLTGWIMLIR